MAQGASGFLATLVTFAYWWNRGIPHTYYILTAKARGETLEMPVAFAYSQRITH